MPEFSKRQTLQSPVWSVGVVTLLLIGLVSVQAETRQNRRVILHTADTGSCCKLLEQSSGL